MTITPSARRSKEAAEAAGITSPLMRMALSLGETMVKEAEVRHALTKGEGPASISPTTVDLSPGMLRDPYLTSMVDIFPGEMGSPWSDSGESAAEGKALSGEDALRYLEKFSYGEFLSNNVENISWKDPWMKAILRGELSLEQREMGTPLLGFGVSPADTLSFIRHVATLSPFQRERAMELINEMGKNFHGGDYTRPTEWETKVRERVNNFMVATGGSHLSWDDENTPSRYSFQNNNFKSYATVARAVRAGGTNINSSYELLLFHVRGAINACMVDAATDYVLHCEMHMDKNPCERIALGELTLSTAPVRAFLQSISDDIIEQNSSGEGVSFHGWPGDILIALAALGDRLNFLSLRYYTELLNSYNKQWAEAACDWQAMEDEATCLRRAVESKETPTEGDGFLEILSAIVYGESGK